MAAIGAIPHDALSGFTVLGELGLDGSIAPVAGVLPAAIGANARGDGLICPASRGAEAAWASPFARLRNRLIGQADDGEGGHAGRNLHLHVDRPHLNALKGNCGDTLDHPGLTPSPFEPHPLGAKLQAHKSRAYCAISIGPAQP
jgi:hypothetical protein